ncbi:hypothetical protein [Microbacterium sp. SCN 69-37]|uniref:hypothetical protein n=1 Tax=Microbacterium sp. SCN 69-37 TaxID=1660115 RepID=UPI000A6D0CDE|nr:hypothetical protein [Microbacterium sp. SCN 69-37]
MRVDGEFTAELGDTAGVLRWVHAAHRVEVAFDVASRAFTLTATGADAETDAEVRRTVDDLLAAG